MELNAIVVYLSIRLLTKNIWRIRNNDKYNIDIVNQGIRKQYGPPQPPPPRKNEILEYFVSCLAIETECFNIPSLTPMPLVYLWKVNKRRLRDEKRKQKNRKQNIKKKKKNEKRKKNGWIFKYHKSNEIVLIHFFE